MRHFRDRRQVQKAVGMKEYNTFQKCNRFSVDGAQGLAK